jgi:RNA ligase
LTQTTARSIWDLIRNNEPLDELLERVPDEYYNWVKKTQAELWEKYFEIETQAQQDFYIANKAPDRKAFAAIATSMAYPSLLFCLLDNKPIADKIWKMLRPEHVLPFREDEH